MGVTDPLIAALEAAGVPSADDYAAVGQWLMGPHAEISDASHADRLLIALGATRILPVLLKYASAEVRREVLRELLGERFAEMGESEAARLYGHKTTDLLNASAKYWLDQIAPAPEVGGE